MKTPRWVASLALPHLFALLAVHRTALAVPLLNPNRIATEFDHYFASNSAANAVDPSNFQHGVPNLDLSLHPPGHYDYPQGVDGHHGYGAPRQPVLHNFQQGVDGQYGYGALHGSAASSHENAYSTQQPPQFTPRFGFQLSDFSTPASTPRPPDHHNSWEGAFQQAEGSSRPRRWGKAPSTSSERTADMSSNQERLDVSSLGEYKPHAPRSRAKIGNPEMLEAVRDAVATRLEQLESKLHFGLPELQGSSRFKEEDIRVVPPTKNNYVEYHGFNTFDDNEILPQLRGISAHGYEVRFTEWTTAPEEQKITGMRLYNILARKDSGRGPNEPEKYFLGAIYIPEKWTHPVRKSIKGEPFWVPVDQASAYKRATRKRRPDLPSYDKK